MRLAVLFLENNHSLYSVELYDNSFLIDSGVFVKSRKGINFSSDFIDKASKEYPSVSIESLLESYGLDSNKVGYHRIYELKRKLEDREKTKEKISADAVEKVKDLTQLCPA